MRLEFQKKDDILIASPVGELDHHSAARVRQDIDKTIEDFGYRHLIFNAKKVTFMDSSGIGVVLGRYKKVRRQGGTLLLAGCSPFVKKILEMAGIFTITENVPDVAEAIERLQGRQQLTMEGVINE